MAAPPSVSSPPASWLLRRHWGLFATVAAIAFVGGWFGREKWLEHEIVSAFAGGAGEAAQQAHEEDLKRTARAHESKMRDDDAWEIQRAGGLPESNTNRYKSFSTDDGRTWTDQRLNEAGQVIDSKEGQPP